MISIASDENYVQHILTISAPFHSMLLMVSSDYVFFQMASVVDLT